MPKRFARPAPIKVMVKASRWRRPVTLGVVVPTEETTPGRALVAIADLLRSIADETDAAALEVLTDEDDTP